MMSAYKILRVAVHSVKERSTVGLSLRNLSSGCGSSSDDDKNKKCTGQKDAKKGDPCPKSSDTKPSTPTIYDCRKYGHSLPSNSSTPCFETLPKFPTGIFRCTAGECLGQGADKCSYYPCPEYFSYHHMTYYDMHMILRCYRQISAKTGRKPI